jgi:peptidoglycan/xylan/chitin deacetylase (PgdA/CDA1 family)
MAKKSTKKHKRAKKKGIKIPSLILFLILVIVGVALGAYLYYQSRAIPELGEDRQMTSLPWDLMNVLGSKTGPDGRPEISVRVPILMYHYVEHVKDKNDTIRQGLNIYPETLKAQIETLKDAGYMFVTPSDLGKVLEGKAEKFPQKTVILSFDDGYMDFYTDVFPILKEENVKAIAYIVPDFLDRPNFMFTFQLKEVAKSPLVEIGAHTMDHFALKGMDREKAEYQISESRKVLQEELNLPINSFAYPYGSFDTQAIELAREAGFLDAVSTIPDIVNTSDTRYYLYRLRPGGRTGNELLNFLDQKTFKAY